jgi:N-carbamoyl-L-amino-acid hydrolase
MRVSTPNRRAFVGQLGLAAAAAFVRIQPQDAPRRADGGRVNGWLAKFDAIGRTAGGINRVAYSEADLAGRTFTLGLFREAGLTLRIDAAGNMVARLEGRETSLPPIVIGSHVDSVTDGGNFDGPVGSFGAI